MKTRSKSREGVVVDVLLLGLRLSESLRVAEVLKFRRLGWREADKYETAIKSLSNCGFRYVVIDVDNVDNYGPIVVKGLKNFDPSLKIIATGQSRFPELTSQIMRAGADYFVDKNQDIEVDIDRVFDSEGARVN